MAWIVKALGGSIYQVYSSRANMFASNVEADGTFAYIPSYETPTEVWRSNGSLWQLYKANFDGSSEGETTADLLGYEGVAGQSMVLVNRLWYIYLDEWIGFYHMDSIPQYFEDSVVIATTP